MANETIRTTDETHYVGTRVYVEIRLFNPRTKVPATALAPALRFVRPDETNLEAGNMTEVEPGTGVYAGSAIVDQEGDWIIEVTLGAPFESKWRDDRLYVAS